MRYFADLVGPNGFVVGVDHDPVSLDFGHRYLSGFPFKNWELKHSDLIVYEEPLDSFDVIILFNCIGYFESPVEVVKKIARKLKRGARLIVKDFDLESFFLAPIETFRFAELIENAKKQDRDQNPLKFTNFFGRNVHFLHKEFNFYSYTNEIWTQSMSYPFNQYEVEYIWRNVEVLVLQAKQTCPKDTIEYFEENFCGHRKSFFEHQKSLFLENEYLTIWVV